MFMERIVHEQFKRLQNHLKNKENKNNFSLKRVDLKLTFIRSFFFVFIFFIFHILNGFSKDCNMIQTHFNLKYGCRFLCFFFGIFEVLFNWNRKMAFVIIQCLKPFLTGIYFVIIGSCSEAILSGHVIAVI